MFDIGFQELLLIAIVGLLILGPERLPIAIRNGALWLGRLKRSFNNLKTEFENEIGASEIKQQLHNESILKELKKTEAQLRNAKLEFQHSIQKAEQEVEHIKQSTQEVINEVTSPIANKANATLEEKISKEDVTKKATPVATEQKAHD